MVEAIISTFAATKMYRIKSFFIILIICGGLMCSFNFSAYSIFSNLSPTQPDTLTSTFKKTAKNYNRFYNDMARYIAGMNPEKGCVLDTALLNNKAWKDYHDTADINWKNYYNERVLILREWSYDEMSELNTKRFKLFYPFSGPDVLHANMFFQNADTSIFIGLEPVGKVPLQKTSNKDSVNAFIKEANDALYAVLNFSFFRTIAMRNDLKINGTLPLLMLLLERTNNRVLDVKGIKIDGYGKVVSDDLPNKKSTRIPGVEITYCRADSTHEAKLYYFSVDISNAGLFYKYPEYFTYLKKQTNIYTFIKSASYLMYSPDFSGIRNIILKQSKIVLQDDSGIPHNYFLLNNFDYTLYGTYTGPIKLFSGKHQPSLVKAYKTDSLKTKPLMFGIGYKYHIGESNLVLYNKK